MKKKYQNKERTELNDEQFTLFLTKTSKIDTGTNNPPAILTIVSPSNNKYARNVSETYPCKLRNMIKNEYQELNFEELQKKSEDIVLNLTKEQCEKIERETVEQVKSKMWFKYRAGCITASDMKRCCRTKLKKPLMTLIKQICYPE